MSSSEACPTDSANFVRLSGLAPSSNTKWNLPKRIQKVFPSLQAYLDKKNKASESEDEAKSFDDQATMSSNTIVRSEPKCESKAASQAPEVVQESSASAYSAIRDLIPINRLRCSISDAIDRFNHRRAASYSGSLADLRYAGRPVHTRIIQSSENLPEDVRALYKSISKVAKAHGVVPAKWETVVMRTRKKTEAAPPLLAYNIDYSEAGQRTPDSVLRMIEHIVAATELASKHGLNEPHCNEQIHSRMLEAVFGAPHEDHAIKYFNMESARAEKARVDRPAFPNSPYRPINYCLTLSDNGIKEASRARLDKLNRRESAKIASNHQSINHAVYGPIDDCPIFVSIGVRSSIWSQDEAKWQLICWAGSHLVRLRQIGGHNTADHADGTITLPLVYIAGPCWHVLFVREKEKCIEVFRVQEIVGTTTTLLGCLQLRKLLLELGKWGGGPFRAWFLNHIST